MGTNSNIYDLITVPIPVEFRTLGHDQYSDTLKKFDIAVSKCFFIDPIYFTDNEVRQLAWDIEQSMPDNISTIERREMAE